jgi:hypothetical protein
MSKRFTIVAIPVVTALIASAGVAVADNQPQTDPVAGSFTAQAVKVRERTCTGADGPYLELRGQWQGVIASSDPRVSGRLEFKANPALINVVTGLGTFTGPFKIIDELTGRTKAEGEFHTVVTRGANNDGFALGKAKRAGDKPAGRFFANFRSLVGPRPDYPVQGAFGTTDDDGLMPAVIQSGQCSGDDDDD